MRKIFPSLFLFAFLIFCGCPAIVNGQELVDKGKALLSFGPGIQNKDFRWSIDGTINGNYINVLSELIFKPVSSSGFFVKGQYGITEKLSARASFGRDFTFSGRVTDRDYNGSNRTNMTTDLDLKSNRGNSLNMAAGLQYVLFRNPNTALSAGAGYRFTKDLFYLLDDNNSALKSTYAAKWTGPYLDLGGTHHLSKKMYALESLKINVLKYKGEANWNLLESVKHPLSFAQFANGYGFDFMLEAGYRLCENLSVGITAGYETWRTNLGTDALYLNTGETLTTTMNGAFRKNTSVGIVGKIIF